MLTKGLDPLVICASYLKAGVEICILRMSWVSAIAGSAVPAWGLLLGGNLFPATVPPGFTETCRDHGPAPSESLSKARGACDID